MNETTGSLNMADWPREAKRYVKSLEAERDRLREALAWALGFVSPAGRRRETYDAAKALLRGEQR